VGTFVSVLASSSGMAVAASYGAILAARVALWLARSLAVPVVAALLMGRAVDPLVMSTGYLMAAPGLVSLAIVLVETLGSAVLVWSAVRRLERA
jgi:DUF917 family protein